MAPEVRAFLPIDLPLVRRVAPYGVSLDTVADLTGSTHMLGSAVWGSFLLTDFGTPILILRDDDGDYLAQFRHRVGEPHALQGRPRSRSEQRKWRLSGIEGAKCQVRHYCRVFARRKQHHWIASFGDRLAQDMNGLRFQQCQLRPIRAHRQPPIGVTARSDQTVISRGSSECEATRIAVHCRSPA